MPDHPKLVDWNAEYQIGQRLLGVPPHPTL